MDKSDENYVFALYFIMLTDVYVKTVFDSSIPYLFIKDRWMQLKIIGHHAIIANHQLRSVYLDVATSNAVPFFYSGAD